MIFPCSDFRHAVMTPAILLMCEYLMRCPVLSVRDAAVGSFLSSLVLSVTKQSQKFCPEALTFLKALLHRATERSQRSSEVFQKFSHLLEVKAPIPLLCVQEPVMEIQTLDFLNIMTLPEDSSFLDTDVTRVGVVLSVAETLQGFVNIYGDLKAFPETFLPISALLIEVAETFFPIDIEKNGDAGEARLKRRRGKELSKRGERSMARVKLFFRRCT